MNKTKNPGDDHYPNSNKRSILYSKQKILKHQPLISNSQSTQRNCKTPNDFKSQTLRFSSKEDSNPNHSKSQQILTTLKSEISQLTKENERLNTIISNLNQTLESLKNENKDLVKALVDIIQVFTEKELKTNIFKNKLLLEIKTTLVSKLEELSLFNLDYKKQIEQVSLWGLQILDKEKSIQKSSKSCIIDYHPLNPLKNSFTIVSKY